MAEFPAPTDGLLLTYLVVSHDVATWRTPCRHAPRPPALTPACGIRR
jgi:hypothetical protein